MSVECLTNRWVDQLLSLCVASLFRAEVKWATVDAAFYSPQPGTLCEYVNTGFARPQAHDVLHLYLTM